MSLLLTYALWGVSLALFLYEIHAGGFWFYLSGFNVGVGTLLLVIKTIAYAIKAEFADAPEGGSDG